MRCPIGQTCPQRSARICTQPTPKRMARFGTEGNVTEPNSNLFTGLKKTDASSFASAMRHTNIRNSIVVRCLIYWSVIDGDYKSFSALKGRQSRSTAASKTSGPLQSQQNRTGSVHNSAYRFRNPSDRRVTVYRGFQRHATSA